MLSSLPRLALDRCGPRPESDYWNDLSIPAFAFYELGTRYVDKGSS